jgi:ATP-binding cassette subfamily B multidrug efflux pump
MKTDYLKKYIKQILTVFFAYFLVVIASLWQPSILREIVDKISSGSNTKINNLGVQLIILSLFGLLGGLVSTMVSAYVSKEIARDMREAAFKNIQKFSMADISYFTESSLVIRLTNDITQIQALVGTIFTLVFRLPLLIILALFLALITAPKMWWIILVLVLSVILLSVFVMKKISKEYSSFQKEIESINLLAKENLNSIKLIKSFVQQKEQLKKFSTTSNKLKDTSLIINRSVSLVMPAFLFLGNLATLMVVIFGYLYFGHDLKGAGYVVAFMSYMLQLMVGIITAGLIMIGTARGLVSLKRVAEIIEFETKRSTTKELVNYTAPLTFQNVSFQYSGADNYAIENVSFSIEYGKKVGIIGESGSGKTTIANLITGLYDVDEGNIEIGNENIKQFSKQTLSETISYILQKPILLKGTIRKSIIQRRCDSSKEQLEKVLEISECAEFITSLENGIDQKVEEQGTNFSGGQKQRIAIAQGIISESPITIFDDSTSAVDAVIESRILRKLNDFLENKTCIFITQKVANIKDSDQILVMDGGHLVGCGTHDELLDNNIKYREIFLSQKGDLL